MKKGCSIAITGLVQGVYFRASTKKVADSLGIKGLVKNKADGSVYVEAEGEENELDKFIDWCRVGPPHARVDGCIVNNQALKSFESFEIVR